MRFRELRGAGASSRSSAVVPARPKSLLAPLDDGSAVLLNVASGTYLRLNATATTIVELDHAGHSEEAAAHILADRWSIALADALADVRRVLASVEALSARAEQRGRRPRARGVLRVAREWLRLSDGRRALTLQVVPVVALVEVGLRLLNLDRLARFCRVELATDAGAPARDPTLKRAPSHEGARIEWAVRWVLARWSFDATCLRQALVFGYLMRRRRPVMHLGLVEDRGTAHAWIMVEGHDYNFAPIVSTFVTPDRKNSEPPADERS